MRPVKFLACLVFLALMCACSARQANRPVEISSIRPALPNTKFVDSKISRSEYTAALGRDELNSKVRLIEVFQSSAQSSASIPEYRVFGVQPGSVYYLLGLRSADVLIGAHGFVVNSAIAFQRYLMVLTSEKSSQIELRRGGQAMIYRFEFVD